VIDMEYDFRPSPMSPAWVADVPSIAYGAGEGQPDPCAGVSFQTQGVVEKWSLPDLIDISANEIYLEGGECPGHYNAAKSASGLPHVRITAPQGCWMTIREQTGYRKLSTVGNPVTGLSTKCSTWNWEGKGAEKVIGPGETVEIRPQTAGNSMLRAKKVYLTGVTPSPPAGDPMPVDLNNPIAMVAIAGGLVAIVGIVAYVMVNRPKEASE